MQLPSRSLALRSFVLVTVGLASASITFACGGESKPPEHAKNMEMVPIRDTPTADAVKVAPTEAVIDTQPVAPSGSAGAKPGSSGNRNARVSAAECEASFDKYLALMAASDPRLQGLPPEVLAQAKLMAQSQSQNKGGSPCAKSPPTREQYECAMASTSAPAWQKCMK